jgi:short subunit dehydrogenase-like uncharacterized protein
MVRTSGTVSGGTFASAMTAFARIPQMRSAHRERRRAEGRPPNRRVRGVTGPPHFDKEAGCWLVPLPTIDPQVVLRSAAALQRYGPDFSYGHYAAVERLPTVVGGVAAAGLLVAGAQVRPLRRFLVGRLPSGQGPGEERRARSSFSLRFIGEGGGRRVFTEVRGGDPGYTETAKMLAESALCLAFDDNPASAGQVTSATAMGDNLTKRLVSGGLMFRVVRSERV